MKRIVLAFLFMLLPTVSFAGTANDAVVALGGLVKITSSGTSYQAFAVCLEDAKSEVDTYLKGDEAKQNKKLSATISEAMGLYEYADVLFKRMNKSKGLMDLGAEASPTDKKMASEYFSRFPEDKKDIAAGGVLVDLHGSKLKINAAINKVFSRAAKKQAKAASMLK